MTHRHLIYVLICFVGLSCSDHKKKFYKTQQLSDRLFVEKFYTYQGGAYGGEKMTYFLTDSLHFRKYIGECDEKEKYIFKVDNGFVYIKKFSWRNRHDGIVIDSTTLNIMTIEKDGVMEQ